MVVFLDGNEIAFLRISYQNKKYCFIYNIDSYETILESIKSSIFPKSISPNFFKKKDSNGYKIVFVDDYLAIGHYFLKEDKVSEIKERIFGDILVLPLKKLMYPQILFSKVHKLFQTIKTKNDNELEKISFNFDSVKLQRHLIDETIELHLKNEYLLPNLLGLLEERKNQLFIINSDSDLVITFLEALLLFLPQKFIVGRDITTICETPSINSENIVILPNFKSDELAKKNFIQISDLFKKNLVEQTSYHTLLQEIRLLLIGNFKLFGYLGYTHEKLWNIFTGMIKASYKDEKVQFQDYFNKIVDIKKEITETEELFNQLNNNIKTHYKLKN